MHLFKWIHWSVPFKLTAGTLTHFPIFHYQINLVTKIETELL